MIIHINSIEELEIGSDVKDLTHIVVMASFRQHDVRVKDVTEKYNNGFLALVDKVAKENFKIDNVGFLNPQDFDDWEALVEDLVERQILGILIEKRLFKTVEYFLGQLLEKFGIRFQIFDANDYLVTENISPDEARKRELEMQCIIMRAVF